MCTTVCGHVFLLPILGVNVPPETNASTQHDKHNDSTTEQHGSTHFVPELELELDPELELELEHDPNSQPDGEREPESEPHLDCDPDPESQ